MKKIICVMIFVLHCLISNAFAGSQHDNITYYFLSNEHPILVWTDEQTNVVYDFALKRFEWDEIVFKEYDITEQQYQITFPKTGMYILMVRARRALTTTESDSLTNMTKEELINQATTWNIINDIGNTINLTEEEIRNNMRNMGYASYWATSLTDGQVNESSRSWWVYCYVAPPPPPQIINGEISGGPVGITIINSYNKKDAQVGP